MFSSASAATGDLAPQKRSTPSIIGADVVIAGVLQSEGDLQIDCRLDGDIRGHNVVIGEDARIHGDIQAEAVTVRGNVEGSIHAAKIALAAGCHVEGDIVHQSLEVELGAFLRGRVHHCADPLAAPAFAPGPQALDGAAPLERRRPNSPMRGVHQPAAAAPVDKIALHG